MKRIFLTLFMLALIALSASAVWAQQGTQAPATATPAAEEEAATATPAPEPEVTASPETEADAAEAVPAPLAYLTLDLEAGFPLDPFVVSVNGGGPVEASTLAEGCAGYLPTDPTLTVNWSGGADFVEAFYYSDHDPVLVVQTPDGQYLCNDDANVLLLDPVVEIPNPEPGRYNIWVGSADAEQLIPGFLVITTQPEVNVGSFSLAGFVKRAAIPENLLEVAEVRKTQNPAEQLARANLKITSLTAGGDAVTQNVEAAGDIAVFDIPNVSLQCNGYVSVLPNFAFDWTGDAENLRVFFESEQDATLFVVLPDREVLCNDDAEAQANLNPRVDIPNPAEGRYYVYVGRLDQEEPVEGVLTITESAEAMPAVLKGEGQ